MAAKEIDEKQVEALAAIGCNRDEIAAFFGLSERHMRRRFKDVIERGRQRMKTSIRRHLFSLMQKGSVPATIFISKCVLGFNDGGYNGPRPQQPPAPEQVRVVKVFGAYDRAAAAKKQKGGTDANPPDN
jgi:hypothetical protein